MQVETSYFGDIQVDHSNRLSFEFGIPGFQDEKDFVLVPFGQDPFCLLQSLRSKHTAFICVNPFLFWSDYQIELDEKTIEQLEVEHETDIAIFVFITVKQPFSDSTVNLNAPVIMNTKNGKSKQYLDGTNRYSTKAPLLATKGGS